MYRSKKEPYKYSMNFNLNDSYFGASPQGKQNAKKWMNGINSAVNQIAKEYNIPEKDLDDIVTVAAMSPITESAYGTSKYYKDKTAQKEILRNFGRGLAAEYDPNGPAFKDEFLTKRGIKLIRDNVSKNKRD